MVSCALRQAGNDSITFKIFCANCDNNKTSMPNSDSVAWRYILACSDTVILANLDHLGIQHRIQLADFLARRFFGLNG
jgi:hypothetical protein